MKKLLTKALLLSFAGMACIMVSCKKEKPAPPPPPTPNISWIESSNRKDTIVFIGDQQILLLNRGKEMRNGYLLPKIWAGPYMYNLKKDSIGLYYSLSSLYATKFYAYKIENDRLYIGDFFQKGTVPNQVLTFEKIK